MMQKISDFLLEKKNLELKIKKKLKQLSTVCVLSTVNRFSVAETAYMKQCCSNEKSCNGCKQILIWSTYKLGKTFTLADYLQSWDLFK